MQMKEEDIRPEKIFSEHLRLCKQDVQTYFTNVERERIKCPACDSDGEFAFNKQSFEYEHCPNCQTLFVSPRPKAEYFVKYYIESSSSKYWATTFYKETAEVRKEKLWKPKAKMILEAMQKYEATHNKVIDVGGGYGLFAGEMESLSGQPVLVIEPNPYFASVCREKSFQVVEKFLEDIDKESLPSGAKAFVSFELFEHLHSPSAFLNQLEKIMMPGDLFIMTTLSGTGVDIQVLWEESKSVVPPHHLNFLNPKSIEILLGRIGLEVMEVTTPGKLDMDILANSQDKIKDRFWRVFSELADDKMKDQWQQLVASSGWSSHMMVICQKPDSPLKNDN